ncbi:MAG: MBOAT family protein [Clostridia bacterium]|nr:MBOAT family protein [Clostridia bacterium]
MSFDSLRYIIFLPVVCAAHWLTRGKYRWAVLLLASYVFYASWNVSLSLLILGVTACSYCAGRLIQRTENRRLRRFWLVAALAVSFGALGYFKYFNFIGQSLLTLTGGQWRTQDIILPVGISFYTFQAMSYVIDVYRKDLPAEKHFGYYALYISFFPQLVAGPIERAGGLIGQLKADRTLSREDVIMGLRYLVSGFFRKLVIADLAAPFVDAAYRADAPDGSAVVIATLLFAIQIYCDFSGYSEIALGSARLLGVRLMRNFDRPYGAANLRDFWRRWHISLTQWFTDYVYIPLGGSRRGLKRQLLAQFVVFFLCGLWHGAEWSFVIWGLLHACFLNLYTLFTHFHPQQKPGIAGHILTLAAVCFAWLFFRANDLAHAGMLLRQLFSPWQVSAGIELLMTAAIRNTQPVTLLLLLCGLLLILRRLPAVTDGKSSIPDAAWAGLLLAVITAALIRMDAGTANAFIYFQF